MRGLPFFKPKNKPQFAGMNFSDGGGGGGDTSSLANKTDLTAIILTGTTNTSGDTITAGTWFYLNGTPCVAKVDIASGATFTLNTNYEEKTIGSALCELNGKLIKSGTVTSTSGNQNGLIILPININDHILVSSYDSLGYRHIPCGLYHDVQGGQHWSIALIETSLGNITLGTDVNTTVTYFYVDKN